MYSYKSFEAEATIVTKQRERTSAFLKFKQVATNQYFILKEFKMTKVPYDSGVF